MLTFPSTGNLEDSRSISQKKEILWFLVTGIQILNRCFSQLYFILILLIIITIIIIILNVPSITGRSFDSRTLVVAPHLQGSGWRKYSYGQISRDLGLWLGFEGTFRIKNSGSG